MVLSKRERSIAIVTGACVGLLLLDHFLLDPLTKKRDRLDADISLKQQELEKNGRLFEKRRRQGSLWAEMQNSGLRSKDASEAEGPVLNSIREWAQDAAATLSSVKTERSREKEKGFQKVTFHTTATGSMSQISRFLWHVQTARFPLRISDLQITTRKEGTDDLSLQLSISTIYLAPEMDKPQAPLVSIAPEVRE